MLLRLTAPDILNTSLIDVATGECTYNISTFLVEQPPQPAEDSTSHRWPSSGSSAETTHEIQTSVSSETMASSSPEFVKQSQAVYDEEPLKAQTRRTTVKDSSGLVVADIQWNGRHPMITILDEKVGALTDLFGSSSVPFQPKILAIPSRFDTEFIWNASADYLTLYDYDTESIKGTFHNNVFRIPSKPKGFKLSPSFLETPISPIPSSPSFAPRSTLIPAHVPGLGSDYLEFEPHPLAPDVEIILSFLMMEILRRGRFNLTPYTFEKPKSGHFKQAKKLFLSRFRRHSV